MCIELISLISYPKFYSYTPFERGNEGYDGFKNLLLKVVEVAERKVDQGGVMLTMVGVGQAVDVEKFNNLEKLLRVTVYAVRFVNNLKTAVHKTKIVKGEIVVEEMMSSEKLWVKYEQAILKTDSKFNKPKKLF